MTTVTTMMESLDPRDWLIKYPLIAHDVGRTNDRSTAVVGGYCGSGQILGIKELIELPHCYGHALASELARVDGRYNRDAVIIADLSSDPTYAEVLFENFGRRVVGMQIGSAGDGAECERRRVRNGIMPVYHVGRSFLFDLLAREFRAERIRLPEGETGQRAYAQLTALDVEQKEDRVIYRCRPGQHDDLGISCAMLVWAALHGDFKRFWTRPIDDRHRPRAQYKRISSKAWAG
jgi:hypothetical protein